MAVFEAMPTASCCDVIHEVKSRASQKDGARCNGQEAKLFCFVFVGHRQKRLRATWFLLCLKTATCRRLARRHDVATSVTHLTLAHMIFVVRVDFAQRPCTAQGQVFQKCTSNRLVLHAKHVHLVPCSTAKTGNVDSDTFLCQIRIGRQKKGGNSDWQNRISGIKF